MNPFIEQHIRWYPNDALMILVAIDMIVVTKVAEEENAVVDGRS